MMSKPGYAHWVRSEIDRRIELVYAEREFKKENPGQYLKPDSPFFQAEYQYEIESRRLIESLGFLPGSETVEVLGELLYDERTGFHKPTRPGQPNLPHNVHASNAIKAARALKQLRVGPVDSIETLGTSTVATYIDVDVYRQWWEEVKAGERDYVFDWGGWEYYKGKYRIRPKEQWPKDPFSKKRIAEPSRKHLVREAAKKEREFSWPVFIAVVILVFAVGVFVRGKLGSATL
ncbi:hypothetical protein, partial [Roseibacillus persicicus]|uniref:hypothetical protein n=1 Tax=Roseibacillus persicicus TaxID=454148 RepID=UPI00280DEF5F